MKILKRFKHNKGVSMVDSIIGMAILIIFMGLLTSGIYQTYKKNASIQIDAIAVSHAVTVLEGIDKMKYEDVTEELNDNINVMFEIPEEYQISIEVQNYNEEDDTKEDLIKIVTVNVNYTAINEQKSYTVKKLKIIEV